MLFPRSDRCVPLDATLTMRIAAYESGTEWSTSDVHVEVSVAPAREA